MTRAEGDAAAPETTVSLDYFTGLYLAKDDPWDVATKWHNQRKYAVTLASLPREHYRSCYEPGASIGLFTRMLAPRCSKILATDSVAEAVQQARENTADLPHVTVEQAMVPADMPDETFDLVVIGDLLYYLSAADLEQFLTAVTDRLEPGGDLVSLHFRDRENGGNYDGHNVHEILAARPGLTRVVHHEDEWFLLDVLRKNP
ncbi:putative methyltransferase [Actinoplanes missouriensis 431]|uniref:Putative methyltransferase n=1 Tax=Actinoplanes missouriensis (strain ATCC 14538 / DSM 43046 / CBS 188.64 / JCM 3121 / NBRC 102363 / NCIMB 12654 / NRRL B-3342 / UNCC 431) TaxID=512565 RepID=I0HD94_ACTM4|nr:class I SAM-dependent methyltransferase [Actinoplanes missouriensis]BAL90981.1 putative methyltransferase [Actinoplanes missouriensis 431]